MLTREALASEGLKGGFSGIYPALKAMDDAGRVRRGYFVAGLGATQFALPGALDLLRSLREAPVDTADRGDRRDRIRRIRTARRCRGRCPDLTRVVGATVVLVDGEMRRTSPAATARSPSICRTRSRSSRGRPRRCRGAIAAFARGDGRGRAPCSSRRSTMSRPLDHPFAPFLEEAGFLRGGPASSLPRPAAGGERRVWQRSLTDPATTTSTSRTTSRHVRCLKATRYSGRRAHCSARWPASTVTGFDTQLAQLAVVDRRAPIAGRSIVEVTARGKHLLIELSGDLVLRTHMRMHGSWHIYRPGERWRAPRRDARIVITTAEWVAIAFNVSDAEFITRDELEQHARVAALGPGSALRGASTSTRRASVSARRRRVTSPRPSSVSNRWRVSAMSSSPRCCSSAA